jgi:hypothetical protein
LAHEIVARFRSTFNGAGHDRLSFHEVQDRLKNYAKDLEFIWRGLERQGLRGYERPAVLALAEELISQEQTLRLNERHGQDSTEAPIISVSNESRNWLPDDQEWPEQGYWLRYQRWMLGTRPAEVVSALGRDTNIILGRMGNPSDTTRDTWDLRGLVVGQVQSGKTQNFVGLIAKAIDMGYRQIVVLSGIHEDLRSQTQYRIDQGITGMTYFDVADGGTGFQHRLVGVREEDPLNKAFPDYVSFTSASKDDGDFNRTMASRVTGVSDMVYIAVVKKTVARLKLLNGTYENLPALLAQPLLIIDDEADQASINNRGKDDPTEINKQIRKLLKKFPRSSYVGYTATPFAVIFGDPDHRTEEEGDELFPRDFIVRLGQGPDYFGPAELFGRKPTVLADELGRSPAETMIRIVDDAEDWLPPTKGKWTKYEALPESLLESVADFIVGAAVKSWRRERLSTMTAHTTMLVNVPRGQEQQGQLVGALERVCELMKRDISGDNTAPNSWLMRCRRSFDERILPNLMPGYDVAPPNWPDVSQRIGALVESKLEVALVNGTVKDMLEYDKHKEEGRLVIAVGGDKLSRGMTLEGLTVSYFLRRSNAWDTLLQMGRWFGYRPGYLDLCRLAITDVLLSRFDEVTQRVEELNKDLEDKFGQGAEPRSIGIYVQESELSLSPTRRTALRGARPITILGRHSAREVRRLRLAATDADRDATLEAARWLYGEAHAHSEGPPPDRLMSGERYRHTFFGVPNVTIADYIRRSVLPAGLRGQSNEFLADNLLELAKDGMVTKWVVTFPTLLKNESQPVPIAPGESIVPADRSSFKNLVDGYLEGKGDLSDARDVWADFTESEVQAKGISSKSNWKAIRDLAGEWRHESRGLLICYIVVTNSGPSAAWHISFPRMPREREHRVLANPVAVRAMYGIEEDL